MIQALKALNLLSYLCYHPLLDLESSHGRSAPYWLTRRPFSGLDLGRGKKNLALKALTLQLLSQSYLY